MGKENASFRALRICAIVVLFLILGARNQTPPRPTLQPIKGIKCDQGLQEGDTLIIEGEVSGASSLNLTDWQYLQFYTKSLDATEFSFACFVRLPFCSGPSSQKCYCVNVTGGVFKTYFNTKALPAQSGTEVKLVWAPLSNSSNSVNSSTEAIPTVYAENSEETTITIDGVNVTENICQHLEDPVNYTIRYCCTNSPSPCNLRITYDGGEINGSSCITGRIPASSQYTFSYSVCDTQYEEEFTCSVASVTTSSPAHNITGTTASDNATVTTSSPALTGTTSPGSEAQEQDEDDLGLILGLTIAIAAIIIIIGVVIVVLRHKRLLCFREKEEVSKQDAPQPTVKPAQPDSGTPYGKVPLPPLSHQHPRRLPPIDQKETNDKTSKNEKSNKRGTSPRRNQVENGDGDGKTKGHDSTDGKNQDQKNSANDHKTDRIPDGQDETNVDIEAQKKKGTPAVFRPQPTRKE